MTTKTDYASTAWRELSYEQKVKEWLYGCEGATPTYSKLLDNLVSGLQKAGTQLDGGNHTIEFPVPAVFYDHTLDTYRPDYEYETVMFNRLVGMLADEGILDVSTDTQMLGQGNDESNFRVYIVTVVEFDTVDAESLLETLEADKDVVSDSVFANLAKKVLEQGWQGSALAV